MPELTVRYFAGARAAAGVPDENIPLTGGATVADVLTLVHERHGEPLARVLASASFLLDGVAVRDRGIPVRSGALLDVLPPFAGG
ncbi:MoaD/ThiS family protein [Umezawaea sp. Da 62-37]|uniref:MoaD/ThiS family protein n=1 Tax=Umezawaea sp. Da 62-37 TaxID=3075927 RepID=UPI0028F73744|nr:MoaD/ThiS family protein [Umezawaea sp. Da 62-37]WNV82016.1 MoaD/ThiS family protein [Umezawaea sp. Da 62-37]